MVNLDAHTDRTLGARSMESTIIAHFKTAQVFRNRPSIFKGQNVESGSEWEAYDDAVGTRWAVPDITFTQNMNIHWGRVVINLEHHPGSAPGALWVVIPSEKILFVGDAVLADQPPFLAAADIPAWLEALDFLAKNYRGYQLVSGRGGPVSFDMVKIQKKTLKDILAKITRIAEKNKPLTDVEKLIPTILANYTFPAHMEELYVQRMRHGLLNYYALYFQIDESLNEGKE
jgi:glyoxylase-like metal-dependent hydrolase (beta-lactamase superfamily II)